MADFEGIIRHIQICEYWAKMAQKGEEMMKMHKWSNGDDDLLMKSIKDCQPIFEHFGSQNKSYSETNAWDAVAGRLLPFVCVTGAACKRRWKVLKDREKQQSDKWDKVSDMVDTYEQELAENTFDSVSEVIGLIKNLENQIKDIKTQIKKLEDMWK
jgi:hypothetical protein